MIFRTNGEPVEINTLAELKAYALGGTGIIEINYIEKHELTGETFSRPIIIQRGYEEQDNGK